MFFVCLSSALISFASPFESKALKEEFVAALSRALSAKDAIKVTSVEEKKVLFTVSGLYRNNRHIRRCWGQPITKCPSRVSRQNILIIHPLNGWHSIGGEILIKRKWKESTATTQHPLIWSDLVGLLTREGSVSHTPVTSFSWNCRHPLIAKPKLIGKDVTNRKKL